MKPEPDAVRCARWRGAPLLQPKPEPKPLQLPEKFVEACLHLTPIEKAGREH